MKLIDCVNALMDMDAADAIRLNDGTVTWDVYNLYDALVDDDEDDREFSLQYDGIYRVKDDGYLDSILYTALNKLRRRI